MTMTLNECLDYLNDNDGYLLLTHIRPDGDTLGSAAALCHILRRMGKVAFMYPNPQVTAAYEPYVAPFLAPPGFEPLTLLSVDLASENLFPEGFSGGSIGLCIDHHPTNSSMPTPSPTPTGPRRSSWRPARTTNGSINSFSAHSLIPGSCWRA